MTPTTNVEHVYKRCCKDPPSRTSATLLKQVAPTRFSITSYKKKRTMKIAVVLLFTIVAVLAEPPVNQYLPPNQYGPPSGNGGQRPGPQYGAPKPQYGAPAEDQDTPASYQYEYMVQDAESGVDFGAEEQREGDVAKGKYYVLLPDGRKQIVEYVADTEGYKPMVTYEGQANGGGYPRGPNGNGNGNGGYPRGSNGGYQY